MRKIKIKDDEYDVTLALSQTQQEKWLKWIKNLPENQWMLFMFDSYDYRDFTMEDVLIPMDIIWLMYDHDFNFVIADIQYATPCTETNQEIYKAKFPSKFVLEINGWLSEQRWYKFMDIVEIPHIMRPWHIV